MDPPFLPQPPAPPPCLPTPSILLALFLAACTHPPPSTPPPPPTATRFRPAGVVRIVNLPQHYLVFESLYPFPPGTRLSVWNHGRPTGNIRVLEARERGFFSADLLEGTARPGDLLE